ncbi:MAG: hypothetical protein FWF20_03305 [Betaproteobacteria bacterium]|nr:hypothetical protein [Betaproteobacteria bacterium]MCL2885809.1 hypothetical protein [Betaproteobacteria bacterium]
MENVSNDLRDKFLNEGAMLIKDEFECQATDMVAYGQKNPIKNVDLLSTSLIANRDIHQTIKVAIRERSENVGKIILATAYFIEEHKIQKTDEAISKVGAALQAIDRQRLLELASAQKKINLSYATLSAVVEIFKRANAEIGKELVALGQADSGVKRMEKTNLYLRSSIIAYELVSFVFEYLSKFGLAGIEDMKHIRDEVINDIENGRNNDEITKRKVNSSNNEKLRDSTLGKISQREKFRVKVEKKWNEMMQRIEGQVGSARKVKGFASDLEIMKNNLREEIALLNIAATTQIVETSIDAIDALATGLQDWELPDLNEDTAFELLNMGE